MMPFFVIVVIVVVAVVAYFAWMAEKKRREALAKLAASLDMSFSVKDPLGLDHRLSNLRAFKRGHSRKAKNVMQGTFAGRELIAFDYQYTTGSGKNRHTYHFSACLVRLEHPFPGLVIRPEGIFDKIGDFLGFDDIDFESDEFSRKFRVTSENRKFAYDICHARMMEWMLAGPRCELELNRGYLALSDKRKWSPERFRTAFDFCIRFFEMIPDFVLREYREKGA